MSFPTPASTRKVSEPRERLLRIASRIFYTRGIHSVGIEEIVSTAEVTRSTLYRHFPGKEDLVLAYLTTASDAEREQLEAAVTPDQSPAEALRAIAAIVVQQIKSPIFRGCAFLNAAAEYPDEDHPVHQAVLAHRQWFLDVVTAQVARLTGEPSPKQAELFVLLRDGAMASGCLNDPDDVVKVFTQGVEIFLTSQGTSLDQGAPRSAADSGAEEDLGLAVPLERGHHTKAPVPAGRGGRKAHP